MTVMPWMGLCVIASRADLWVLLMMKFQLLAQAFKDI